MQLLLDGEAEGCPIPYGRQLKYKNERSRLIRELENQDRDEPLSKELIEKTFEHIKALTLNDIDNSEASV